MTIEIISADSIRKAFKKVKEDVVYLEEKLGSIENQLKEINYRVYQLLEEAKKNCDFKEFLRERIENVEMSLTKVEKDLEVVYKKINEIKETDEILYE